MPMASEEETEEIMKKELPLRYTWCLSALLKPFQSALAEKLVGYSRKEGYPDRHAFISAHQ